MLLLYSVLVSHHEYFTSCSDDFVHSLCEASFQDEKWECMNYEPKFLKSENFFFRTFLVQLNEHPSSHQVFIFFIFLRQSMKFCFINQFLTDFSHKVSNDIQCSITSYYDKNLGFFMKIHKFWAKMSFRSLIFLKRINFGELQNKFLIYLWF